MRELPSYELKYLVHEQPSTVIVESHQRKQKNDAKIARLEKKLMALRLENNMLLGIMDTAARLLAPEKFRRS